MTSDIAECQVRNLWWAAGHNVVAIPLRTM